MPAEPIQDGDMVVPTDDSEEEDPSEHELISNDDDDSVTRISGPTSTPTPAGILSPAESVAGRSAGNE